MSVRLELSSVSAYPSTPKEALFSATGSTVQTFIEFKRAVDQVTPDALRDAVTVGASLHWSDRISMQQVVKELTRHGIPITSQDLPDIESIPALVNKIVDSLSTRSLKSAIHQTILDGGWYLVNTGSKAARIRHLHQAMEETKQQRESTVIIKTSLPEFLKLQQSHDDRLLKILDSYAIVGRNIAFALEIQARQDTPATYMEAIRQLNNNGRGWHGMQIYADLDLGHLAETAQYHPGHHVPDVNEFVKQVLEDTTDARLVATVSLNQWSKQEHTHVWFGDPEGVVHLPKVGGYMEEAKKRMPFGPVAIVELNPIFTPRLLREPHILGYFLQHFSNG